MPRLLIPLLSCLPIVAHAEINWSISEGGTLTFQTDDVYDPTAPAEDDAVEVDYSDDDVYSVTYKSKTTNVIAPLIHTVQVQTGPGDDRVGFDFEDDLDFYPTTYVSLAAGNDEFDLKGPSEVSGVLWVFGGGGNDLFAVQGHGFTTTTGLLQGDNDFCVIQNGDADPVVDGGIGYDVSIDQTLNGHSTQLSGFELDL